MASKITLVQTSTHRGDNAIAVTLLFLLYGWSMTPLMYPASFYFSEPSTAYVCLIVVNLFTGITTVVVTFMLSLFTDDPTLQAINKHLESVFVLFPNYNLGKGLMDLTYNEYMNEFYSRVGSFSCKLCQSLSCVAAFLIDKIIWQRRHVF